jgi:hypothetical protein
MHHTNPPLAPHHHQQQCPTQCQHQRLALLVLWLVLLQQQAQLLLGLWVGW